MHCSATVGVPPHLERHYLGKLQWKFGIGSKSGNCSVYRPKTGPQAVAKRQIFMKSMGGRKLGPAPARILVGVRSACTRPHKDAERERHQFSIFQLRLCAHHGCSAAFALSIVRLGRRHKITRLRGKMPQPELWLHLSRNERQVRLRNARRSKCKLPFALWKSAR